jgi:hypothetical protein
VLDQVVAENPGLIAHVEWHVYTGAPPMYSAEANAKWRLYPPPYQGQYATPWLWVDGVNKSYTYNTWTNAIYQAMNEPADVSLTHVGTTYDPALRSGELAIECFNGTADTLRAALQFAVTEDSVRYTGSNGDPMHNAVLRDYVPNQNGTPVTLAPGASDTITLSYALQSAWVEENVKLVVYLQNMTVQPDSSLPCYQGSSGSVLSFAGVEESKLLAARDLRVSVSPNPVRTWCEFAVSGAAAHGVRISVYAPDGRSVGSIRTDANRVTWSRAGVARGVYLYRVNAGTATAEGKLVVAD